MSEPLDLDFSKRLLERRMAIQAGSEARQQEGRPVELDPTRVGRLSRMDAMQQQAMAQATKQRLDMELNHIASALARIASGEYGYCTTCGDEIAKGRLLADLTTLTCIACATAAEKKKAGRQ